MKRLSKHHLSYVLFILTSCILFVSTKFVFQTDDYYPLSRCQYGLYGKENFRGIELEIIRETLVSLKWVEDIDFMFECKKFTEMLKEVKRNATISGAFGAIAIQTDKMKDKPNEAGLRFSQQTMENSVSVIAKDVQQTFYFLNVLEWKAACIAVIVIPSLFAIATYYFEGQTVRLTAYLFQYLCAFFFLSNNIKINEIGSRLLQKFYWLSILIFISLYTARLITETTKIKLGGIQDEGDFRSKEVLILNAYVDVISNLRAKNISFDEDQGTEDIEKLFRNNTDIKYLATDDIILEYLVYRECDFYFVTALKKLTTFKFAMAFGQNLGSENENKINKAILDIIRKKTFDARISDFFKSERIESCPKTTMRYRDSYNLQDTKELGLIYFCVFCLALVVAISIFCYLKKKNKIMDKGTQEIDLRDRKNKEITEGIKMLMTVYCKANEVKVNDNILGRLTMSKRMAYEMLRNKFNNITEMGEENIWDGIMKTSSDDFRRYIEGNASLHELLNGTKPGRQSAYAVRRASRKVHPIKDLLEEEENNSSTVVLHRPSRLVTEGNSSPRHKAKLSIVQRLSLFIPLAFFKQIDVPVFVKLRVKEYLENMHLKTKNREISWFKKATRKALTIFSFKSRVQTMGTKGDSTKSFKFQLSSHDDPGDIDSETILKSRHD